MKYNYLSHAQLIVKAQQLAASLNDDGFTNAKVYAIPRGGVPVVYLLSNFIDLVLVNTAAEADVFVDDIYDSGATAERYQKEWGKPVYCLVNRADYDGWVVFPWENSVPGSAEDIPRRLLQFVGEDPNRGGLLETPMRFLKAWKHYTAGYHTNPADILKVFEDGAERCDEMVLVRDIPVYSHCEHHMAPFFGIAHVGYIPNGKIVGLSKLSRLVDIFSRRLQVQERLTNQIADAMVEHLAPKGVGVILRCRHMCMEARGIQRQGTSTITSAMRGVLLDDMNARSEFLRLSGDGRA